MPQALSFILMRKRGSKIIAELASSARGSFSRLRQDLNIVVGAVLPGRFMIAKDRAVDEAQGAIVFFVVGFGEMVRSRWLIYFSCVCFRGLLLSLSFVHAILRRVPFAVLVAWSEEGWLRLPSAWGLMGLPMVGSKWVRTDSDASTNGIA